MARTFEKKSLAPKSLKSFSFVLSAVGGEPLIRTDSKFFMFD